METPEGPNRSEPIADVVTFPSGAKRSGTRLRYDLIPACALRRIAARFALGAGAYGDRNWEQGLPFSDTFNHIIEHLLTHAEQRANETDDNLAAAAWGCIALMWLEENDKATP